MNPLVVAVVVVVRNRQMVVVQPRVGAERKIEILHEACDGGLGQAAQAFSIVEQHVDVAAVEDTIDQQQQHHQQEQER